MQLIDEENDILRAADLIHDRFDALFKLAAVFRPGDHQGEIQGDDFLVAQKLGHVPVRNLLRQAFRDGGFPDAGFT